MRREQRLPLHTGNGPKAVGLGRYSVKRKIEHFPQYFDPKGTVYVQATWNITLKKVLNSTPIAPAESRIL